MVKKIRDAIAISLTLLSTLLLLGGCTYLTPARFGSTPEGKDLENIQHSPNYADGAFHNQIPTSILKEGQSKLSIVIDNMTSSAENLQPSKAIPSAKVDIKALDPKQDIIIWLGHSSFYVQLAGQRILIDPVLSDYASPVSFAVQAFEGATIYSAADIPDIDLLLITHDHWDHLDYDTVTALKDRISHVFVPLGVGVHFKSWGYAADKIYQADWYGQFTLNNEVEAYLVPARHYSGRGLTNNKTLWGGFVLESPEQRILFGGDSGYGPHFKELGQKFGYFDVVALDMGQYDPRWPYIHMTPEQAAQAALDLNTRALLPAHVGRFSLAQHDWREPFEHIMVQSKDKPYKLLTPLLGEALYVSGAEQDFSPWWHKPQPILIGQQTRE